MSLVFDITVMGICPAVVGLHMLRKRYGEIFRPILGLLLFRKRKMRYGMDVADLFRVGNGGTHVNGLAELEQSYKNLQAYIDRASWYRRADQEMLVRYYKAAHADLFEQIIRAKRKQQEAEWRELDNKIHKRKAHSWWREALGLSQTENDPTVIKKCYRKLVSKDHPDRGGNGKMMPQLNKALDAARKELNFV